jgi:hypothetical protein
MRYITCALLLVAMVLLVFDIKMRADDSKQRAAFLRQMQVQLGTPDTVIRTRRVELYDDDGKLQARLTGKELTGLDYITMKKDPLEIRIDPIGGVVVRDTKGGDSWDLSSLGITCHDAKGQPLIMLQSPAGLCVSDGKGSTSYFNDAGTYHVHDALSDGAPSR